MQGFINWWHHSIHFQSDQLWRLANLVVYPSCTQSGGSSSLQHGTTRRWMTRKAQQGWSSLWSYRVLVTKHWHSAEPPLEIYKVHIKLSAMGAFGLIKRSWPSAGKVVRCYHQWEANPYRRCFLPVLCDLGGLPPVLGSPTLVVPC